MGDEFSLSSCRGNGSSLTALLVFRFRFVLALMRLEFVGAICPSPSHATAEDKSTPDFDQ